MSKNNKPSVAIKPAAEVAPVAETKEEGSLSPQDKAQLQATVNTVLGDASTEATPEDAARAVMEANAKAADEQALKEQAAQEETKRALLAEEAEAQAAQAAEAAELKVLADNALAKAALLAEKDDVSIMVKTITHELQKYLEVYQKSNIPVAQRIAQHSALIRLFENVIGLKKAEDFIGCMDVILATYKENCAETQAFHEAVVNRYSSQVSASMKSTLAFQFFIYMLSVVATHHSKVIPTNFAKDISNDEFGKHFPGVNGERLLLWATRMCQ